MELTAWERSDKLVSLLTSLRDHVENGRGEAAQEVVKKVQEDGAHFKVAVDEITEGLNMTLTQKTEELEATQRKKGNLEKAVSSLTAEVQKSKARIVSFQGDVRRYEQQERQADQEHHRADREWDEGYRQRHELRWFHFIPIGGWIKSGYDLKKGNSRMAEASRRMSSAKYDKERAQSSLNEAIAGKKREKEKLLKERELLVDIKSKIYKLHREVTCLKDATESIFELGGVLKELLVVTDAARYKTDRLKGILGHLKKTPRVLNSRGTRTILTTHDESWMNVRSMVQGFGYEKNALMYREAAERTQKQKYLKDILRLFGALNDSIELDRRDDTRRTLDDIVRMGRELEACIRLEVERNEHVPHQFMVEYRSAWNMQMELRDIGLEVGRLQLHDEASQKLKAASCAISLGSTLSELLLYTIHANKRTRQICEHVRATESAAINSGLRMMIANTERYWQEVNSMLIDHDFNKASGSLPHTLE